MGNFISIDSGTTNTRIYLIKNEQICDVIKLPVGARDTVLTGSTKNLKEQLKKGIDELLAKNSTSHDEIECAIVSGMITSEFGLLEVPHAVAPIGLDEMVKGLVEKSFPDICPFPMRFVAGVKNTYENSDEQDMMRGEETEAIGILASMQEESDVILVLPGSHLKIVEVRQGKITKCYTSLLGEASSAISQNTLLKDIVHFTKEIDYDALYDGYQDAMEKGINMSLFKVRKLSLFAGKDEQYLSSYFNGVMMSCDVKMILSIGMEKRSTIVVGGSSPVKEELAYLIRKQSDLKVVVLEDSITQFATAMGAIEICKKRGE